MKHHTTHCKLQLATNFDIIEVLNKMKHHIINNRYFQFLIIDESTDIIGTVHIHLSNKDFEKSPLGLFKLFTNLSDCYLVDQDTIYGPDKFELQLCKFYFDSGYKVYYAFQIVPKGKYKETITYNDFEFNNESIFDMQKSLKSELLIHRIPLTQDESITFSGHECNWINKDKNIINIFNTKNEYIGYIDNFLIQTRLQKKELLCKILVPEEYKNGMKLVPKIDYYLSEDGGESILKTDLKMYLCFKTDDINNTEEENIPTCHENTKNKKVISWNEYFMGIAKLSAKRSKDPVKQVGACIVGKNQIILGIGYNGFPRNCSDSDFPWSKDDTVESNTKYPYVVHAELNAILNSTRDLNNATLYVTLYPCSECVKAIIQSGIKKIIYLEKGSHDHTASDKMMKSAGIKCISYSSLEK